MYMWWRTWHDDQRKLWAERFMSGDPREAKQHHADDLEFRWANNLNAPSVSSLDFTDEKGQTKTVNPGGSRFSEHDRTYHLRGADQVSTQVKAEVQPAEPGSSPGGSTELPF